MIKRYAILGLVLAAALSSAARVAADHRVYLPALPTPAINQLLTHGSMTYCLDAGGEAYPNFAAQVIDVFAAFEAEFGLAFTKVPWAGGGCQYMLAMREFPAGKAAARIFYANWPAIAEFRPSLGFWRWNSAIAHETGHLLGLHEQYMDSTGLIGCDANAASSLARLGFATMMSCGTFISVPTDRDKEVEYARGSRLEVASHRPWSPHRRTPTWSPRRRWSQHCRPTPHKPSPHRRWTPHRP